MKRLLKIILLFLISYGIMVFITLDWNIITWEYYDRVCMLTLTLLAWFITLIIETADKSLNDESTRNDEIFESYYKNKK